MRIRPILLALAAAGLLGASAFSPAESEPEAFDALLQPGALCGPPATGGQPRLLKALLAQAETKPFPQVPAQPALDERPRLYRDLGRLQFPIRTKVKAAQSWFKQGMLFAYGFNHAEAQRAFREAQRLDPECAMCFWGEAYVLGPNINAPMAPEAAAPAHAAIQRAVALAPRAAPKEQALIAALAKRYAREPAADRAPLDRAYANAMAQVAKRYPGDDNVQALHAEALMDTQPWDYWEAGGTKPKGGGARIVAALEKVLARNPAHPGAAHFYIHAMEASSRPEKALPAARVLASAVPGAGHLVHMPSHIYYRLGMYREALETNKRAMAVDERYFESSPSDPLYKTGYYPHNIHFVMVSAQMGGDAATALEAAARLDASIPVEAARQFPIVQPVKAAPYTTHALFSEPAAILALPAPDPGLLLVKAMYHYARAVAHAARKDATAARREIEALDALERTGDLKPFTEWAVPAREVIRTARWVAAGRLADAMGDLDAAAKAYGEAIFIEDSLAYMEPPYWYYPVRQSLGAVRLRQGRLDEAEKAFRDSLSRVRNNGWALAGLAEVQKRRGDTHAERATRKALARTWFGDPAGPALEKL